MIGAKDTKPQRPVRIKLDWRAYWERFKQEHGGNPVLIGGRLAFADGWRYSASDFRGPEFSPPESEHELQQLKKRYWQERRNISKAEHQQLKTTVDLFEQESNVRSLPLQHKRREYDSDGKSIWTAKELDLEPIKFRLTQLQNDLDKCDEELACLEMEQSKSPHSTSTAAEAIH